MITKDYLVETLHNFENLVLDKRYVRTYSTMPTDAELLEMPNGTKFRTLGYYSPYDGNGATYLITDTYQTGARILSKNTVNGVTSYKMLVLCDGGNRAEIDVCKFGIRSTGVTINDATVSNTYADENSRILASICGVDFTLVNGAVLKFPAGRFYFSSPMTLSKEMHIKGEAVPRPKLDLQATGGYANGTVLVFPWLNDGESAVTMGHSNLENLTIFGNPSTYSITINRDGALSSTTGVVVGEISPSNIITETVAKDDSDNDIHCTGIKSNGNSVIKNVVVTHFYAGAWFKTANTYIENFHANHTHTGLSIGNDTKCRGLYGWGIHTLLEIRGSLSSACQVRADSCVNLVHILSGTKITLTDVDGDWCTDSVLLIGDSASPNEVSNCVITGLHGRCSILSGGFDRRNGKTDIREVADSTKYGLIRIANGCAFRFNYVVMNSIGAGTLIDGAQYMRTPTVALTFESGSNGKLIGNHFVIKGSHDPYDGTIFYTYNTDEDIRKAFMLTAGNNMRIDTDEASFNITGTTVKKTLVVTDEQLAAIESQLQS